MTNRYLILDDNRILMKILAQIHLHDLRLQALRIGAPK